MFTGHYSRADAIDRTAQVWRPAGLHSEVKGVNVSKPTSEEPLGDLGGKKTWSPEEGEQGISNRPDDESKSVPPGDEADDDASFQDGASDDEDDDEQVEGQE